MYGGAGRSGFFVPVAGGDDPGGFAALECELRKEVQKICREYVDYARGKWIKAGHHDLAGKAAKALALKNSAIKDDLTTFKQNICEFVDWLDRNRHEHTRLRGPLLRFEEACAGMVVPYDAGGALAYR